MHWPPADKSADESGFSLVEILVVLVIASMLAIAVGGLISFAVLLRDRSAHADRTLNAIFDLEALRSALLEAAGPSRGVSMMELTTTGFGLTSGDPRPALLLRVDLGWDSSPSIILSFGTTSDEASSTTVDLSAFDAAAIDYLLATEDAVSWVSADSLEGESVGARLTIRQGMRHWTIPLWIVPKA